MINGEVRPPATYLRRRGDPAPPVPRRTRRPSRRATPPTPPSRRLGRADDAGAGHVPGDLIARRRSEHRRAASTVPRRRSREPRARRLATHCARGPRPRESRAPSGSRRGRAATPCGAGPQRSRLCTHRRDADRGRAARAETRAESPAATDDDEARATARREASLKLLAHEQLADLRGEYWIAVLERYGLLPNYTLLDDSVTLDVGAQLDRPGHQRVSDRARHAPSAAPRGAPRVRARRARSTPRAWRSRSTPSTWARRRGHPAPGCSAPPCGFGDDHRRSRRRRSRPVRAAAAPAIADAGQHLDVVELTHVSAEVRRDEAIDQRPPRRPAARALHACRSPPTSTRRGIADALVRRGHRIRRHVPARPRPCAGSTSARVGGRGRPASIAGDERPAPLFRVCAACGKLDAEAGRATAATSTGPGARTGPRTEEHRARSRSPHAARPRACCCACRRDRPSATTSPCPACRRAAARAARADRRPPRPPPHRADRRPDAQRRHRQLAALLLHDTVPGGTGYLAELADHERIARAARRRAGGGPRLRRAGRGTARLPPLPAAVRARRERPTASRARVRSGASNCCCRSTARACAPWAITRGRPRQRDERVGDRAILPQALLGAG